ncbi:MAG: rod shape-determining protein MreC, partial [Rickettsiales bacterium]|nr:rod shape-determining protein MreC [Rickettsiales bacterium]
MKILRIISSGLAKSKYLLYVFMSIVVLYIDIEHKTFFNSIKNVTYKIANPISYVIGIPIDVAYFIIERTEEMLNVYSKNKELLKTNIEMQAKYIEYLDLKKENEELKKILDFKDLLRNNYLFVSAEVLLNENSNLLVNVGTNDGISEGDIVLGTNKNVIGKVINVSKKSSVIMLLNESRMKILVKTLDGQKFILVGNGVNMKILHSEKRYINLNDGDLIFTENVSNIIGNLFIGFVRKINDEYYVLLPQNVNDSR